MTCTTDSTTSDKAASHWKSLHRCRQCALRRTGSRLGRSTRGPIHAPTQPLATQRPGWFGPASNKFSAVTSVFHACGNHNGCPRAQGRVLHDDRSGIIRPDDAILVPCRALELALARPRVGADGDAARGGSAAGNAGVQGVGVLKRRRRQKRVVPVRVWKGRKAEARGEEGEWSSINGRRRRRRSGVGRPIIAPGAPRPPPKPGWPLLSLALGALPCLSQSTPTSEPKYT